MNTYKKYCPNVFLAQCEEEHKKGDIITIVTKYGKENEHIVHNLIGKSETHFFYSITRVDGYNAQKRAEKKAEKFKSYAGSAEKRSDSFYKNADLSEEKSGIPLGQPILVGHHSERGHRKALERADNNMRKCVEASQKAEEYEQRAKYWKSRKSDINLSMPESLEYYEHELEKAKNIHQEYKDGTREKRHSYSVTYANKKVKELEKKLELARKLWS